MKKLLLILLPISIFLVSCGGGEDELQPNSIYTYVPDNNFELKLINMGLDNILNDTVLTSAIDTVKYLNLDGDFHSLVGLESFISIEDFTISTVFNNLNSIDLSSNLKLKNLNVFMAGGSLKNIDLSNNTKLEGFGIDGCWGINSLDLRQNINLKSICISYTNITNLDVSNLTDLESLCCNRNQLLSLNIKNGNNSNMSYFNCLNNNQLYCIEVDDVNYANLNFTNIPSQSFFSEDCGVK